MFDTTVKIVIVIGIFVVAIKVLSYAAVGLTMLLSTNAGASIAAGVTAATAAQATSTIVQGSSVGAQIIGQLNLESALGWSKAVLQGLATLIAAEYLKQSNSGSGGSSTGGSGNEGTGNKLTEQQKNDIKDIADKYDNLECKEASQEIQQYLKERNIKGDVVDLNSSTDYIVSDSYGTEAISQHGTHQGVMVDGIVYDNLHTTGLPYDRWLADFYSPGNINVTITPIR